MGFPFISPITIFIKCKCNFHLILQIKVAGTMKPVLSQRVTFVLKPAYENSANSTPSKLYHQIISKLS